MSRHWSSILAASDLKRDVLLKDYRSCYDGISVTGTNIRDVRELVLTIQNRAISILRVYIIAKDSGILANVGWVVNDGISFCLICSKKFSASTWRHHCRACGVLACASCVKSRAYLAGFERFGKQRVCKQCNPDKAATVSAVESSLWGKSVSSQFLANSVEDTTTVTTGSSKGAPQTPTKQPNNVLDLWKFGPVQVRQVQPRFVLLASRKDRSIFVNVCACEHVPRYASQEKLMLLVGAAGETAEGVTVYDVAAHPAVLTPDDGAELRQVSRRILAALVNLRCEEMFSIMYILPDNYTYQERKMTATEQDAAELDHISLSPVVAEGAATVKGPSAQSAPPTRIVALVVPSAAAFHHHPQLCTTRSDLTKSASITDATWKKYRPIKMSADGILTPGPSPEVTEAGARAEAAVKRIPELHVTTRQSGKEVLVRGVLYLPVLAGYVIQAPSTYRPGTPGSGKSAPISKNGTVRINVLQHAVVDDLIATGAVPLTSLSDDPMLMCDQPGTHSLPDGTTCTTYHVAMDSKFIGEVEGTVGPAFDSRVRKIIAQVNERFKEGVDPEQFAVTALSTHIFRGQDVPLLLYEYPAASSAQARADTIAVSSKGSLPLSPEKQGMRRVGSREALIQKKGWPTAIRTQVDAPPAKSVSPVAKKAWK